MMMMTMITSRHQLQLVGGRDAAEDENSLNNCYAKPLEVYPAITIIMTCFVVLCL